MSATTQFWLQYAPLVAAGVLALVLDAFGRRSAAVWAAALGALTSGAVGLYGGWTLDSLPVFKAFFVGAGFSTVPGLVALLSGLALAGSAPVLAGRRNGGAVAALVAFAAGSAGLVAASYDLIALVLAIETTALASYAFVSAARSRRGDESAMKYYIQGAVSTGLLLLGVSVLIALYAPDGSYATLIGSLSRLTPKDSAPALLGVLLVTTAFAFKAGAAPFHSWAPDAYENAPAETAAVMAGPVKLAFLFAAMLLVSTAGPAGRSADAVLGTLGADLMPIVGFLGVLSVAVGSLAALRQRSYTRMLGYAGVAQVGYALIAMSAVSSVAVTIFAATYAVAATGAFLAAVAVARVRPGWAGDIDGLAGLGRARPVLGVAVSMLMVSLAGLPPLVGFWGKFEVFVATIGAAQGFPQLGSPALGWLYGTFAVIGLAGSVVSLAYYGRVVRVLFAEPGSEAGDAAGSDAQLTIAVIALVALIALAAGIAPLVMGLSAPMDGFLLR